MPEGHTIHRIARDQRRDFVGQSLQASSPQGRFAGGAAELNGRRLVGIDAHGKHLCYVFAGERRVHVHLGLYGKFRRHTAPPPAPRGQVRLRMIGDRLAFDLNGPNRCELLTACQWTAIRARLGPDPLRHDGDPEPAWGRIRRSRAAIGALLLDQSVIAGVGNVYRSEVLHQIDVHPARPGASLSRDEFDALWSKLAELMAVGVRHNRIIIADPQDVGRPRSRMRREERLLVYKKDRCYYCGSPIDSWLLGGRKVFACPECQVFG